jgi:hypothetical protein
MLSGASFLFQDHDGEMASGGTSLTERRKTMRAPLLVVSRSFIKGLKGKTGVNVKHVKA